MFKDVISNCIDECNRPFRSKNELFTFYVENRLKASIKSYYADLVDAQKYLQNRQINSVIRKM